MSAAIIPFGAPAVESDRKAEFLQHVSAAFDSYVHKTGQEPEACVHALGGIKEPVSIGWHITDPSCDGADAMLARTIVTIQRELARCP
jgi:hypothetical protein